MEDYNDKNSQDGKVQQLAVMAPEKRRGRKEDPQKDKSARPQIEITAVHSKCFFSISSYPNV